MNTILEFQTVYVTIAVGGDYYQILFHDDLDRDDEPYFLIQTQLEYPDCGECHFESHNYELVANCRATSASLSGNRLCLSYGKERRRDVEIRFGSQESEFRELASALKEMIPEEKIEQFC